MSFRHTLCSRIVCAFLSSFVCLAIASSAQATELLKLPVIRDNSIVLVDSELNENAGQKAQIRVKGNQHIVIMDFDLKPLAGRRVQKATLVCRQDKLTISAVSLSTIATPWDEIQSTALWCGVEGTDGWGYSGARLPAVCGGNSGTLVHQSMSNVTDGWYHWNVHPDLVHAMSAGLSFGLAIHEHDADYGRNPTIFSREQSGKAPYLLVETSDDDMPDPEPVTDATLVVGDTDTVLTFLPGANAFSFDVLIGDVLLPRHNVPLLQTDVQADKPIRVPIRDVEKSIAPDKPLRLQVTSIGRSGKRSAPATIEGIVFRNTPLPKLIPKRTEAVPSATDLSVIPVLDKYDQSGKAIGSLPDTYRQHNSIFDGQRIRLSAAAGEVTGFQLLLRGQGNAEVDLRLDQPYRTELWQSVYVPANGRMIPDPLLPLPPVIGLKPDEDVSVVADLFIPFDAKPGVVNGHVLISDGRRLEIEIAVRNFALPREATFLCEMNGYGLPDHVQQYYDLQKIAYDHRVHSNILHYSHNTAAPGSRKSNLDMRLPSGRRMDNRRYDQIAPGSQVGFWDDFEEAFSPVLDGSLFEKGHRGPVPVPGFYLTFHESWPLNCRAYFNGNPDAYEGFRDAPVYAQTFRDVLTDFARLATRKHWDQTHFQVYFNNKGSLNDAAKAPWILDEPAGFWDYRALQYYGELKDQACASAPLAKIDYRVDISRPEFCRGQLAGRKDLWVVAASAFHTYGRLVRDRIDSDGLRVWVYGTSNDVHETNRNLQAWALDARCSGASGLVPWQTVNKDGSALRQADQLGLFIFDEAPDGSIVIRHSLRLKAWREAQQLMEYINLLGKTRGWTTTQLRDWVENQIRLESSVRKTNDDDAGTTDYRNVTAIDLDLLREAAATLIETR